MPNRIIKESICVSEQIDRLSYFDEITFYRLLVNCDDYGCFDARAKVLKARLFPLKDVKLSEVEAALKHLAGIGLIQLYTVDGQPYLKVVKWADHQRVRVSKHKYPTPDEGTQLAEDCENSRQVAASCGKMPSESESESESNNNINIIINNKNKTKRFDPPTVAQVAEYCQQRNNGIDAEHFVAYYTARDWKLNKNQQMKDWKAAVITWEKNERGRHNGCGNTGRTETENQDYSFLRGTAV